MWSGVEGVQDVRWLPVEAALPVQRGQRQRPGPEDKQQTPTSECAVEFATGAPHGHQGPGQWPGLIAVSPVWKARQPQPQIT